ncbi:MAG: hypothetical protein AB1679_32575 [Actinomycetota bacterium]
MERILPEDDGSHPVPPDADEYWQESWFLGWYDPAHRAAGFHHLGLQGVRGRADVWSWIALDGTVVGKYQNLRLPLPADDLSDLTLGPLHVLTKTPLRSYALSSAYENGNRSDVVYDAFIDPFSYSLGGDIGKDHYESMGRVTGSVTVAGTETEVSGWAFQDHSWGARHWGSVLAHRWIWATFGPDLFCSAFSFTTPKGRIDFGYVYEGGEFRGVTRVDTGARVADDGHSPVGCDARLWTADGRGYHITGACEVTSVSSHDEGFFVTDGMTVFECGGRLGTGIFELNEVKAPAPWHRDLLGL